MSKSQKIREFRSANPEASATEIQAALKKDKIEASLPLIYQVLSKKATRRKAANASKNNGNISVETLLEAKKVVAQTGSIKDAHRALDLLEKLSS